MADSDKPDADKNDKAYMPASMHALGIAIGEFRAGLIASGVPDMEALEITKAYVAALALSARPNQEPPDHGHS